eukprot:SM000315S11890  [mRNA]  locus=s315:33398:36290:+ [translate_table: standard]
MLRANGHEHDGSGHWQQCDRFIPNRRSLDLDIAQFSILRECTKDNIGGGNDPALAPPPHLAVTSPVKVVVAKVPMPGGGIVGPQEEYKRKLAANLLRESGGGVGGGIGVRSRGSSPILSFKSPARQPTSASVAALADLDLQAGAGDGTITSRRPFRHIPEGSERILDAPELVDDYYLNLLDWSSSNVVAVALGTAVYLWEASGGTIQQLMQADEGGGGNDYVTSVAWAADGRHLAVGLDSADVQLWDASRLRQVRTLRGHGARVASLAWSSSLLTTGGLRVREHVVSRLAGHDQEVCGLRWAPSGRQLASGGNDNRLHIWDVSAASSSLPPSGGRQGGAPIRPRYLHRLEQHTAAVKALAWCPFQVQITPLHGHARHRRWLILTSPPDDSSLLSDRCIRFWNTTNGTCLNSIDTHSQVCALQWSTHEREILSSHGFSQNQLCLWRYPTLAQLAELRGHSARVLHLAQSPDGHTVVSAAADETLRFWQVFGQPGVSSQRLLRAGRSAGSTASPLAARSFNIR